MSTIMPMSLEIFVDRRHRMNEERKDGVSHENLAKSKIRRSRVSTICGRSELKGAVEKTPTRIIGPPTTLINEAICLPYHPSNEGKRLKPAVLGVKAAVHTPPTISECNVSLWRYMFAPSLVCYCVVSDAIKCIR
ncbi:hypothetical protein AVEN_40984-1 [Araneus ventricosus]|uniref:Uncharacterized protein n=1 Tax=Araneus ventricosus TaxID=182803 RepID=A0A4Y2F9E1_ARAVE|nr:hypothetical protein AVEN_40984-1 [Araneus ventricosus]